MTTKTDTFKNKQIPKWEDGDLANGSNFSQLITAIATLVDETKTETKTEAKAEATTLSNTALTDAKSYADSVASTQATLVKNNLEASIQQNTTEIEALKQAEQSATTQWFPNAKYSWNGSSLSLQVNGGSTTEHTPANGTAKYLQSTTESLLAVPFSSTDYLLVRTDGALLKFSTSTKEVLPVPALIG